MPADADAELARLLDAYALAECKFGYFQAKFDSGQADAGPLDLFAAAFAARDALLAHLAANYAAKGEVDYQRARADLMSGVLTRILHHWRKGPDSAIDAALDEWQEWERH